MPETKTEITSFKHIQFLVDQFYGKIKTDDLLGDIFNGIIQDEWPSHLDKMYRFWETVLLDKHTYKGSPFLPHAQLPVEKKHFERWLSLFTETVDDYFFGEKAECFHCHGGFNFTFEEFHNNGLYEQYDDLGRWEVTGKESDKGKFKVPTLRNIEYTFPYMHDGSMNSLEEVVDHYASGGANHPQKSGLIRRFILSEQEKEDLVNFLKALSDPSFLENPAFQPVE